MIFPESWKQDVCKGLDPSRSAAALQRAGFLDKGDGEVVTVKPGAGGLLVLMRPGPTMPFSNEHERYFFTYRNGNVHDPRWDVYVCPSPSSCRLRQNGGIGDVAGRRVHPS